MGFVNVDLDLYGGGDLEALVRALDRTAPALHNEKNFACFELARDQKSPEAAISRLCKLIEKFPVGVRTKWKACKRRVFSIGVEADTASHATTYGLSVSTLSRVAKLNAEVEFVVYRSDAQHTHLVVTGESFAEVANLVKHPRKPTRAMQELVAGKPVDDDP